LGETNDTAGQVAFSPEGKLLVSAGQAKIVYLWDRATGKEICALRGHTAWVRSMAFSSDGKTLATGDQDGNIRIWDLAIRKQINVLTRCDGLISWLSFSLDGKELASASEDQKVRLWDVASGKEIHSWEGETIACVAFSPTSSTLAMTGKESSLWVRDAASGKVIHRLDTRMDIIFSISYSPDGRLIAAGGENEIFLFEASTGQLVLHRQCKKNRLRHRALSFSPDCRCIAAAGLEDIVLVWDLTCSVQQRPVQRPELTPVQLAAVWSDLIGEDAPKAHRAIWSLVATPTQALPLLKKHLRPAQVDSKKALQLIERLDDERFAVRKKAEEELEKMGQSAVPALRQKVGERASTELQRKIERLLQKLEASEQNDRPDRAIAVLEYLGTADAKDLLKSLASGSPEALLTKHANAALGRLARRAAVTN
jgi:hypothetical protein